MINKLRTYYRHPIVQQLHDVRVLGLVSFCVLVLLVSWSGVRAIQRNFTLQRQIAQIKEENDVYALENANRELRNEYYESERYLELSARRQFGRGAPGEKLLLVSKETALAHAPDLSEKIEKSTIPPSSKPGYQKNFEAWLDFFLNRPPAD